MTNQIEKDALMTREELRNMRKKEKQQEETQERSHRVHIRFIPTWLRLLIVLILVIVSAIIGVIVGYSVIGTGDPGDALRKETWQHILDIVNKK